MNKFKFILFIIIIFIITLFIISFILTKTKKNQKNRIFKNITNKLYTNNIEYSIKITKTDMNDTRGVLIYPFNNIDQTLKLLKSIKFNNKIIEFLKTQYELNKTYKLSKFYKDKDIKNNLDKLYL